jgi:hypothetical protein
MADKNTLAQMLEHLVNEDQQKAEELFHEYVVAKSREIYEGLIESEIAEEEDKDDEDEDEDVEEAAKDDDAEEDQVDENFEDIAIEGDDEEGNDMGALGGDETDDLEAELDAEGDDDEGEKDPEELFQDLDAIVDELQAKFDELSGGSDEGDDEMGDEMKDDFDLETVREYVEKVAPAKMGDNGANTKSIVAGKNDMGGTAANIVRDDTANDGEVGKAGGQLKGSSLFKGKPTEDNAGNINVPGGKAGNAFSKKEPGHGAEKKGAGENAENKQSLFRGRR